MSTKFDVGQRVTYPVVHTADGNVTGIAVTKAGVTRYAIGLKWYAEEDLKLAAEEKPDTVNPVTEPAKESEPVKLYCVKSYAPGEWVTKGKIYELGTDGTIHYDDGYSKCFYDVRENSHMRRNLVPLVRRPAKVGEWVYIDHPSITDNTYTTGDLCKVIKREFSGAFINTISGKTHPCNCGKGTAWVSDREYLVLDGYTGDPA